MTTSVCIRKNLFRFIFKTTNHLCRNGKWKKFGAEMQLWVKTPAYMLDCDAVMCELEQEPESV